MMNIVFCLNNLQCIINSANTLYFYVLKNFNTSSCLSEFCDINNLRFSDNSRFLPNTFMVISHTNRTTSCRIELLYYQLSVYNVPVSKVIANFFRHSNFCNKTSAMIP